MSESENPILHVIVVGFHHKKGCQVFKDNFNLYVGKISINNDFFDVLYTNLK